MRKSEFNLKRFLWLLLGTFVFALIQFFLLVQFGISLVPFLGIFIGLLGLGAMVMFAWLAWKHRLEVAEQRNQQAKYAALEEQLNALLNAASQQQNKD